jgi:hypothetical protein
MAENGPERGNNNAAIGLAIAVSDSTMTAMTASNNAPVLFIALHLLVSVF